MKITIATQVYNAKDYIGKCMESVLNQTYTDFEYIIVDNGCTDGTEDILKKYAKTDNRIKLRRFEKNLPSMRWIDTVLQMGTGEYVAELDSDDWYDSRFLEYMVKVIEETNCDIVVTGTAMHFEGTNQTSYRSTNKRMVIDSYDFANLYSYYHVFFRTIWAKLVKMDIIRNTPIVSAQETGVINGLDTLNAFAWLRNTNRICVDNSILHHYLFHKKSISHTYNPQKTYADLYLYNDALDFLSLYGPISQQNQSFLYLVYANAINDTHINISSSTLSPEEKLKEYGTILSRDVTKNTFLLNVNDTNQIRQNLLSAVLDCASKLNHENDNFNQIKAIYFPVCGDALSAKSIKLFLKDKLLLDALLQDNRESIIKHLLTMIEKQQMIKQFDLAGILTQLSQDKPLLLEISDMKFFRKFGNIYLMLFNNKYEQALENMTDILLKESVFNETFLQLYLSVAALLEYVEAFIFGKVKLAVLYCTKKQYEKCRVILDDLTAMGVEDNDELVQIKVKLNR